MDIHTRDERDRRIRRTVLVTLLRRKGDDARVGVHVVIFDEITRSEARVPIVCRRIDSLFSLKTTEDDYPQSHVRILEKQLDLPTKAVLEKSEVEPRHKAKEIHHTKLLDMLMASASAKERRERFGTERTLVPHYRQ